MDDQEEVQEQMDFEDDQEDSKERVKEPNIPLSVHVSQGDRYRKLFLFTKALACYEAALKRYPNNEKCLLGRAKCLMSMANYEEAKKEAEAALNSNPNSPEAKTLIAEVEYLLGDFEKSFIIYCRAHKTRPSYDAFRIGQQECRSAIDNALRPDDTWFDADDVRTTTELLSKNPQDIKDYLSTETSIRSELYAEDVKCLKTLLSDKSGESVHTECSALLKYLEDQQRFWRYQNPNTQKQFTTRYKSTTFLHLESRKNRKD